MSNERIDLTWLEGDKDEVAGTIEDNICGDYDYVENLLTELKRCFYEIDLLQEYAKCVECGGRYIGPMDYGLHEWDHSEDCEYYYDASE